MSSAVDVWIGRVPRGVGGTHGLREACLLPFVAQSEADQRRHGGSGYSSRQQGPCVGDALASPAASSEANAVRARAAGAVRELLCHIMIRLHGLHKLPNGGLLIQALVLSTCDLTRRLMLHTYLQT